MKFKTNYDTEFMTSLNVISSSICVRAHPTIALYLLHLVVDIHEVNKHLVMIIIKVEHATLYLQGILKYFID